MTVFPSLRPLLVALACAGGFAAAQAQSLPADAPAGTTVQCKDGSYAAPAAKSGACRGHKGIKTWFGAASAAAAPAAAAPAAAPAPAAPAVAKAPASPAKAVPAPTAAAPGGAPGQVWANDSTKVYHCAGDRYYGKTKHGEYMSEADAKAKGMHAARNKACG